MHPMTSAEIETLFDCWSNLWRRPRDEVCVRPEHRAATRDAGYGVDRARLLQVRRLPGARGKVVILDDRITVPRSTTTRGCTPCQAR